MPIGRAAPARRGRAARDKAFPRAHPRSGPTYRSGTPARCERQRGAAAQPSEEEPPRADESAPPPANPPESKNENEMKHENKSEDEDQEQDEDGDADTDTDTGADVENAGAGEGQQPTVAAAASWFESASSGAGFDWGPSRFERAIGEPESALGDGGRRGRRGNK